MTTVHEEFNHSDADIIIQSSDNVQFHLHRKNLELNAGAFPGAEFESKGETVHLTESANVLGLLFKFVYQLGYPDLEDLAFEVLLDLAEAAEKYEVMSAMYPCAFALRGFVKDHPTEVFVHALKHGHLRLADISAPHIVFSNDVAAKIPYLSYVAAWSKYRETTWNLTHEAARKVLMGKPMNPSAACQKGVGQMYIYCYRAVVQYLWGLEKLTSLDELGSALDKRFVTPSGCQLCGPCAQKKRPIHMRNIIQVYKDGIKEAKKFSDFIRVAPHTE